MTPGETELLGVHPGAIPRANPSRESCSVGDISLPELTRTQISEIFCPRSKTVWSGQTPELFVF